MYNLNITLWCIGSKEFPAIQGVCAVLSLIQGTISNPSIDRSILLSCKFFALQFLLLPVSSAYIIIPIGILGTLAEIIFIHSVCVTVSSSLSQSVLYLGVVYKDIHRFYPIIRRTLLYEATCENPYKQMGSHPIVAIL